MAALRGCFARTQTWQQAGKYVSALASELPRRNGWTMAEQAGDRSPDRMQRLLNRASWDAMAAMSQVRRFAAAGLEAAARRGRRRGGLVIAAIDETGQQKSGSATAGVKRHYMGCAGRVANGITTVHVSLVRERTGHALAGARQWIPREQVADPVTSLVTGLPLDLRFRTKGQLAMDICATAAPTACPSTSPAGTRSTAAAPSCGRPWRSTGRPTCCGSPRTSPSRSPRARR
jgi:SRSO17 transposase